MKKKGVSLLETILAAAILSGAVVTVCGIGGRSLRSMRLNQEYEKAWDYLNRQLVLIDQAGPDVLLQSGQLSGQFASADGRQWKWTAAVEKSSITNLYDVAVRMEWPSGSRICQVQCHTRLCGRGAALEMPEENTAGQSSSPSGRQVPQEASQ
ncbi:MAG TPA: hypothetical protein PK052_05795 [Anaerohalosphaeraceae bacterium]|nr:hypothetical protein [Phycisphaerae bacterium]HOK95493.1 hypothetical protein [Anaerohalosphaeraceae bacterium]HOL31479.1 hypothetical protein [Anaerohalosphaeraceae bacterium]HOM76815.1 hypothetical protein [Anaerohalosphaeraceae bacterium]HPC64481.1 hypothetical protein [Anaerohalosphaeraceae bacterium]